MFPQNALGPSHGVRHIYLGLLGALRRPGGVKMMYSLICSTISSLYMEIDQRAKRAAGMLEANEEIDQRAKRAVGGLERQ